MNEPHRPPDFRRRRFGASVRAALAVAFAAGILVAANALSTRLYAHWSTGSVRALSDRTLEVLRAATGVVEATAVFERDHPFRDAARDLLDELAAAAGGMPGLSFRAKAVDVNHDIAEAAEIFRRHPGLAANSIVFTHRGRSSSVDEYELAGEGGFDGERACVSALLQIVRPVRAPVYFLSGHGEYDPADRHPVTGASSIGRVLAANGFDARPLVLGSDASAVPAACRILAIAGPRTVFPQRELEILADYLAGGGRLLLLADDAFAGGLGALLELWGLRLEAPPSAARPSGARRSSLSYGDHPAVRRMDGVLSVFVSPCGVAGAASPAATAVPPRVTPLVSVEDADGSPRCVAAASEAARSPRANTRIAVFGDADFVSNAMLDGGLEGNALLFLSVVEWLSGDERPVVAGEFGGVLDPGIGTSRDWNRLGIALAIVVPVCILAFGILLYVPFARRR